MLFYAFPTLSDLKAISKFLLFPIQINPDIRKLMNSKIKTNTHGRIKIKNGEQFEDQQKKDRHAQGNLLKPIYTSVVLLKHIPSSTNALAHLLKHAYSSANSHARLSSRNPVFLCSSELAHITAST